ncbi:MAG: C4-dicarboxylate ABC transporter [Nitrosomonas sp.]|nr:MAG: C4-dicarboxylate ABC transporter [Nitrosomonas sp.]
MKTSHILAASAAVVSATFFSILATFGLPESVTEWLLLDEILGIILYLNYLVIIWMQNSNKVSASEMSRKVSA